MKFTLRSLFAACAMFTSSIFAFPGMSAEKEAVVALEHIRYNVTIPGDNLTKLSGRFGVSVEDMLAANPKIEARANRWLYLGETVIVPVYVPEVKYTTAVADDTMVAVPMGVVRDKDAEIATLQKELNDSVAAIASVLVDAETVQKELDDTKVAATQKSLQAAIALAEVKEEIAELQKKNAKQKSDFYLLTAILVVIIVLVVISLFSNSRKDPGAPQKEEMFGTPYLGKTDSAKGTDDSHSEAAARAPSKSETVSAQEHLVELLKKLKGAQVVEFLNSPLLRDECGNQVDVKNLPKFMKNRAHLNLPDALITEWQAIINAEKASKQAAAE